jgi:dihydrofolate synthase/folylpolyglutamate synthase
MKYQEVISYLYDMLPMYQRIGEAAFKKDLSNTRELCKYLGNPQKNFKSIHVAGTNGKGSSSHMLAAVLAEAGYKTGLYTSPHLKHFNERIKVNGIPVSEDYIVQFVNSSKPAIEKIRPSFFELTVAMAFDYFSKQKVDIAIIEVGLGGRLDSTNVIKPVVSLITNISYDHQEMLGDSLEEIANEKAGIIKKQVPVIIGERADSTDKVFMSIAKRKKAQLIFASDRYQIIDKKQLLQEIELEVLTTELSTRNMLRLGTPDLTQIKNIPGVLGVIDELSKKEKRITSDHINKGLRGYQSLTGLKGRWQIINKKPLVITDIAHNKAGFENLLKQLLNMKYKKMHFVLGFTKEKDIGSILPLFPREAKYTFCQAKVPRAMDAKWLALQAALYDIKGEVIPDVNLAKQKVMEKARDNDIIFIGGSTFVVAELHNL